MKEYRIRELNGNFNIQIKEVKTKGMLWWKKEVVNWYLTDSYGDKYSFRARRYIPIKFSPTFYTMREALEQIEQWNAKPIYHNISERCPNHDNPTTPIKWEDLIGDFPEINDDDVIDIYVYKNGVLVWPKK